MDPTTPLRTAIEVPANTNANPPRTEAEAAELTIDGLQWMLLHSAVGIVEFLARCKVHSASCEVWLNAYDAAPESVRESLTRSGMTNAWSPAIEAALLTETELGLNVATPLGAFVRATPLGAFVWATKNDKLSDDIIKRLFQVLQRCGLFAATDRCSMAEALFFSVHQSARAFAVLIADPNADAALPGPTRCSAGDAHNPPRHHSLQCDGKEVTVHEVLYATAADNAVWRAFTDARLPFGARAMAEEWASELTGACGCPGVPRIDFFNALHYAIHHGNDEAGEWLATRLPPKRLNEDNAYSVDNVSPLIAALRSHNPMTQTVAALLSRVPDADLTLRVKPYDGSDEYTAAEWITRYPPPKWLPSHLAAELKLKTEQFGSQYLPSAAVLCTEQLFVHMGVPRELVNLVLHYTALPQPHLWLNAWPRAASGGTADELLMFGLTHRPAEQSISGQKRDRDTAFGASTGPSAAAPRTKRTETANGL